MAGENATKSEARRDGSKAMKLERLSRLAGRGEDLCPVCRAWPQRVGKGPQHADGLPDAGESDERQDFSRSAARVNSERFEGLDRRKRTERVERELPVRKPTARMAPKSSACGASPEQQHQRRLDVHAQALVSDEVTIGSDQEEHRRPAANAV